MTGSALTMSKEDAIARVNNMDRDKRSQQAIVDLMTGKGRMDRLIHQIPGGAHLTEQLDSDSLKKAVFTWLRRVRDFERFEISFCGDYETDDQLREKGIKPRKIKYMDFAYKAGTSFYWRKKGIVELANVVANAINETEDLVAVVIDREGVFVYSDTAENKFSPENPSWNPVLIIHRQT